MERISLILVRIAVAFPFLYAAVAGLLDPFSWVGFLPDFTERIMDPFLALKLFGLAEIILALWILTGFKQQISAGISSLLLLGIIIQNFSILDVIFRDISIFLASIALIFMSKEAEDEAKYLPQ